MEELLQPVFGGEALTYEQLAERLNGMELADLSQGGYVEREQFDALNGKYAQLYSSFFEDKLLSELHTAGARNVKAVKALLDMDKIALEGGALTGLVQQLDGIRQENTFLFEGAEPVASFVRPAPGIKNKPADGGSKANAAIRAVFGKK